MQVPSIGLAGLCVAALLAIAAASASSEIVLADASGAAAPTDSAESPPTTVPLKVWAVSSTHSDAYAEQAVWDVASAVRRFTREKTGLTFDHDLIASTVVHVTDSAAVSAISGAFVDSLETRDCRHLAAVCKGTEHFDADAVNVYYAVGPGWASGMACPSADTRIVMVDGARGGATTLAHELGHVLSLGHLTRADIRQGMDPDVVRLNTMCASGCEWRSRDHFTAGQVYRMHVDSSSVLNKMGWRLGGAIDCDQPGVCPHETFTKE